MKPLLAVILTLAVFALPAPAFAGIVVKSAGPSADRFPVGTKLDDKAIISLKDGDSITVLTERGTRIMLGEGRFRVGDKPKDTNARFDALKREKRQIAASMRGGPSFAELLERVKSSRDSQDQSKPENDFPRMHPSFWNVDVAKPGPRCVFTLAEVRLARFASEPPPSQRDDENNWQRLRWLMWEWTGEASIETFTVNDSSGEYRVDVTFDADDLDAPLDPARMPIVPGQSYFITSPGGTTVETTFALIDMEFERADLFAEALIKAGCMAQVDQLSDFLSAD